MSPFAAGSAAVAIGLWVWSVHTARFDQMGALGLASVLGWSYWIGLAAVAVGFARELSRPGARPASFLVLTVVLVLFLFGTAPAIEPVAALPDSWLHASFANYVLDHGRVLNNYDARFSWPGFFGLAALSARAVGWTATEGFLRWFPLAIEMLYLVPLRVIARRIDVSAQAAWLGVALFYAADWIYQDYFSPQALNTLLYLVVIAGVLALFDAAPLGARAGREGWAGRLADGWRAARWRRLMGHDAVLAETPANALLVTGVVGAVVFASAISHQLTPYAIILALVGLAVTRRLGRPELIVASALFTVGWLSLGASNFWIGHLSLIFGGIGQVGSTIGANVTSRVVGSASHLLVVRLRILLVAGLFGLAGVGVLRRDATTRTLEVLTAAPFVLVALQSYGGEGLMRAVLFALPFSALLAGAALWPADGGPIRPFLRGRPRWLTRRVLGGVSAAIVLVTASATTLARGGNDAFEAFASGEVSAVNYIQANIQPGQTVGAVIYYVPSPRRGFEQFYSYFAGTQGSPSVAQIIDRLLAAAPQWVILGKSQEMWGEIEAGYPKGWIDRVGAALRANGYAVARHWSSAEVLSLVSAPSGG